MRYSFSEFVVLAAARLTLIACLLVTRLRNLHRCLMATSIVLELQAMASDSSNNVVDLLRKALIVAVKLQLAEFENWVRNELEGYPNGAKVPEYRQVHATMHVRNPYHGLQPLMVPPNLERQLCNVDCDDGIGALVQLLDMQSSSQSRWPPIKSLPTAVSQMLMRGMDIPLEPVRCVSETQLWHIIDSVRSTVLDWALKLEMAGIVGDGLTFSAEEKTRALRSSTITITNFQGVLGDISQSTLNQQLTMSVAKHDLSALRSVLASKGIDESELDALEAAIADDVDSVHTNAFGSAVSTWVSRMLIKASNGTWAIGAGAAGDLLAQAIGNYYGW